MFTTPVALIGQPHAFLVDGHLSMKLLARANVNSCVIYGNALADLQVFKILCTY